MVRLTVAAYSGNWVETNKHYLTLKAKSPYGGELDNDDDEANITHALACWDDALSGFLKESLEENDLNFKLRVYGNVWINHYFRSCDLITDRFRSEVAEAATGAKATTSRGDQSTPSPALRYGDTWYLELPIQTDLLLTTKSSTETTETFPMLFKLLRTFARCTGHDFTHCRVAVLSNTSTSTNGTEGNPSAEAGKPSAASSSVAPLLASVMGRHWGDKQYANMKDKYYKTIYQHRLGVADDVVFENEHLAPFFVLVNLEDEPWIIDLHTYERASRSSQSYAYKKQHYQSRTIEKGQCLFLDYRMWYKERPCPQTRSEKQNLRLLIQFATCQEELPANVLPKALSTTRTTKVAKSMSVDSREEQDLAKTSQNPEDVSGSTSRSLDFSATATPATNERQTNPSLLTSVYKKTKEFVSGTVSAAWSTAATTLSSSKKFPSQNQRAPSESTSRHLDLSIEQPQDQGVVNAQVRMLGVGVKENIPIDGLSLKDRLLGMSPTDFNCHARTGFFQSSPTVANGSAPQRSTSTFGSSLYSWVQGYSSSNRKRQGTAAAEGQEATSLPKAKKMKHASNGHVGRA